MPGRGLNSGALNHHLIRQVSTTVIRPALLVLAMNAAGPIQDVAAARPRQVTGKPLRDRPPKKLLDTLKLVRNSVRHPDRSHSGAIFAYKNRSSHAPELRLIKEPWL